MEDKNNLVNDMPHTFEAEQALLASIIMNPTSQFVSNITGFLKADHFYGTVNAEIYSAIMRLRDNGTAVNPVILNEYLQNNEIYKNAGGIQYITDLVKNVLPTTSLEEMAKLIADRALRRSLIGLCTKVTSEAYTIDMDHSATDVMQNAEKEIYLLSENGVKKDNMKPFRSAVSRAFEVITEAVERGTGIRGVSTGFKDLDNVIGGLNKTDLLIIGGRPGMGKTAFVTNIAFNVANSFRLYNQDVNAEKQTVVFFSLEMSADQLATRILSQEVQISMSDMLKGKLNQDQVQQISVCSTELDELPLYIDDTPGITISEIKSRCRQIKHKQGLGLVIIDYLQLVDCKDSGYRGQKTQEITELTRQLKIMAKELNVPVIVLSQLNRSLEKQDDKRPGLADLRDSGSIEQDADVVMFVHREYYFIQNKEADTKLQTEKESEFIKRKEELERKKVETKNLAEIVVAKNRHGGRENVKLSFVGEYTRFGDYVDVSQF
ncbi:MAG: replicative DNA helicase [Alphaproteobacteria bacterium]|nr:replicative DNA helicase [Alphaproteobacteria bacterium]